MTLPKDEAKPEYNFTYPSERQYYDEETSELVIEVVANATKSGAYYGIIDQLVTTFIASTASET